MDAKGAAAAALTATGTAGAGGGFVYAGNKYSTTKAASAHHIEQTAKNFCNEDFGLASTPISTVGGSETINYDDKLKPSSACVTVEVEVYKTSNPLNQKEIGFYLKMGTVVMNETGDKVISVSSSFNNGFTSPKNQVAIQHQVIYLNKDKANTTQNKWLLDKGYGIDLSETISKDKDVTITWKDGTEHKLEGICKEASCEASSTTDKWKAAWLFKLSKPSFGNPFKVMIGDKDISFLGTKWNNEGQSKDASKVTKIYGSQSKLVGKLVEPVDVKGEAGKDDWHLIVCTLPKDLVYDFCNKKL